MSIEHSDKVTFSPYYGDVTELNTQRTILDSVGKESLNDLTADLMNLLETSLAVYETNGDYALGNFNSGWCQVLDSASRMLCDTGDNSTALTCGKWLCHDNCWKISKKAIDLAETVDDDCAGGLKIIAEPIIVDDKVEGVINFGYGDPPKDEKTLKEIAKKYKLDLKELRIRSEEYRSRPEYIVSAAKKRLKATAKLIGEIIHSKRVEKALKDKNDEFQNLIEEYHTQNEEYLALNEEYQTQNEELVRSKEKISESEKQFRELFENMEQGFALHEMIYNEKKKPIDYRFVLVNEAFEKLTGLKKDKIIGKSVKEVLPEIEQIWIDNYGSVAKTGKSFRFENHSEDLNKYYDVIVYSPKKDFFATIFTDVTKNKQIEKELIVAKEKAEESNKLKTAFLQNMSHEIRTPLNAISGFSGVLRKPDLSEEKRNSYSSIIQNSSKQLISIVSDILTISALETHQEEVHIEVVDVNEIILDLQTIFSDQASNQNLSLNAERQLNNKQSEIFTDRTKLTQVLSNFLTNAFKFTHEGFIEFGYKLNSDKPRNEIVFYVKDSGIGIKEEFHDKIFERFRQAELFTNEKYGGTGLGLAISKAYAELLGGKIWLESEPGKGSVFYFSIPYIPVIKTPNKKMGKEISGKKTLLVAEDEEYNFLFIEEVLADLDLNIIHARDGQETIDVCKENSTIDLILMDIKMPRLDGHSAAKSIKKSQPELPIIAQSAYALQSEIELYKDIFDDYLSKPIDEKVLKELVLDYLKVDKQ